jgi:uncharacterized protein YlxW (UPF0749 family)
MYRESRSIHSQSSLASNHGEYKRMKPSKADILICNKRELNSKVSYWENQKRKAEKQLQKLQAEIKELEEELAKEKLA